MWTDLEQNITNFERPRWCAADGRHNETPIVVIRSDRRSDIDPQGRAFYMAVLDQFRDEPSQVFVLEPNQDTSPKPLTELFTPEYLSQFSLGDLFAHLEFGGDTTDDPAP